MGTSDHEILRILFSQFESLRARKKNHKFLTKGQTYGKALYPIFSHINHNCLANAKYKIDINSWEVQVRAQKAISKGEEITIQYLSTVLGTHKRRKRIKGN